MALTSRTSLVARNDGTKHFVSARAIRTILAMFALCFPVGLALKRKTMFWAIGLIFQLVCLWVPEED